MPASAPARPTPLSPALPAAPLLALALCLASALPAAAQGVAAPAPAVISPPAAATTPSAVAAPTEERDLSHAALDAVVWVQRAAEWEALALQAYASATDALERALATPGWTAAIEQQPGYETLPPAVILDVDETVLDNSFFQARLIRDAAVYGSENWSAWCSEAVAPPLPGALAFCRAADELGVTVFYVTNRRDHLREATRQNLRLAGFPLDDQRETLLPRVDISDKSPRRASIAATHRIVLIVGDNLGDFASVFRELPLDARSQQVNAHRDWWGERWIMLPNPMYGDWKSAVLDYQWSRPADELLGRFHAALRHDPVATPPTPEPVPLRGGTAATERTAPRPRNQPSDQDSLHPAPPRHPLLAAGPMGGWTAHTESSIWLQTTRPADVQLRYWPQQPQHAPRLSAVHRTSAEGDHMALVVLTDLQPGQTYGYEVYIDGEHADLPWTPEVTTRGPWLWHGPNRERPHDPPAITFTFGSCAYVNDPPHDRPGQSYGGQYEIFESIAAQHPDFMVWTGDNTYFREADWLTEAGMRRRYAHTRRLPELQRLLGTTHHYATWDDHDFGPNDSDRSFPLAATSSEVFASYWPSVQLGLDDGRGVCQHFTWGDCEFFLLDDRTWRSPVEQRDGPAKRMLGRAQMDWLKDALLGSAATFKFVVCGSQMINPIAPYEAYADYPSEQRELFDFLHAQRIEGLLFLSGDRHHSELLQRSWRGGTTWYEFTSSPLTSGASSAQHDLDNPARVAGTLVREQRSFGRVEIRGPWGKRNLVLSAHGVDGHELWRFILSEQDLRISTP